MWRIHELHHSDAALGVTAAVRVHWLEGPLRLLIITLPMGVLLDFPLPDLGGAGLIGLLWLFYIHLNVRLPLGPLTGWISGPQWHRLHHSRELRHRDCNFALYFPFWDRLFGTYRAPAPGEYPATGTDGGEKIGWRDWLWPRRLRRAAPPPR